MAITSNSCARAETESTDQTVYVQLPAATHLDIVAGDITELVSDDSLKIARVHFESVRGGATYLFGKIKYNVTDGNTAQRLSLLQDNTVISTFSLTDVVQQPSVELDSFTIFILK